MSVPCNSRRRGLCGCIDGLIDRLYLSICDPCCSYNYNCDGPRDRIGYGPGCGPGYGPGPPYGLPPPPGYYNYRR